MGAYHFRSYRELKTTLGTLDAMIEVNELALRSFIDRADEYGSVTGFVADSSERYGIRVNVSDLSGIQSQTRLGYIVTAYQAAELFFKRFGEEHAMLYEQAWDTRNDGETPIAHAIRNMASTHMEAYRAISRARIALFDYYRWVRNRRVHMEPDDDNNRYGTVEKYLDNIHEMYPKLSNAPHRLAQIDFDDFILFSSLIIDIADAFCTLALPPVEILEKAAVVHARNAMGRFGHISDCTERLVRMMANELVFNFGLDSDAATRIACDVVAH